MSLATINSITIQYLFKARLDTSSLNKLRQWLTTPDYTSWGGQVLAPVIEEKTIYLHKPGSGARRDTRILAVIYQCVSIAQHQYYVDKYTQERSYCGYSIAEADNNGKIREYIYLEKSNSKIY
jgi:hypothetical protein